jgi:hypothetical protein
VLVRSNFQNATASTRPVVIAAFNARHPLQCRASTRRITVDVLPQCRPAAFSGQHPGQINTLPFDRILAVPCARERRRYRNTGRVPTEAASGPVHRQGRCRGDALVTAGLSMKVVCRRPMTRAR